MKLYWTFRNPTVIIVSNDRQLKLA